MLAHNNLDEAVPAARGERIEARHRRSRRHDAEQVSGLETGESPSYQALPCGQARQGEAQDRRRRLVATTRARLWWLITSAPVAGLLVAFWMLPFYAKSHYLNDMGWERVEVFGDFLFWREDISSGGLIDYPTLALVLALAFAGATISVALRNRAGVALAGFALASGLAFVYVPEGRLWNTRLLGFYYLSLGMLAAVVFP